MDYLGDDWTIITDFQSKYNIPDMCDEMKGAQNDKEAEDKAGSQSPIVRGTHDHSQSTRRTDVDIERRQGE
ncbi:unnamed protein product [Vitrella brassicaformis CCMP3155]|uniref:Uncharacterized protein n=1 Tax=Vitrella brassicaformis (strain CCMP3155) TaxID=1169540 RepID=A0A0G4F989_VITBC|nr:unnamed protein product [Vitrella brassicaformis CCMP3155]|eukprot:CEM08811.1 unnamed protein product [Vitrella brassicaformis CCMP3155]